MQKFTIFFVLFSSLLAASAQSYEQVSNAASYAKQAYYQLANGTSTTIYNDAWDLAFTAFGQADAGVLVNESSSSSMSNPQPSLELYLAPTSDFSVVLNGNDLTERLYNPDKIWTEGAFNTPKIASNPFDIGWGVYNMNTHVVEGNRVFAIKLRNGDFRKCMVEKMEAGVYTLKVAMLDNSSPQTFTFDKANANGANFLYFSFTSGIVTSIPTTWDLVFQRYTIDLFDPGSNTYIPYNVLGVLHNNGIKAAKASGVNPATVSFNAYTDSLSSDIDRIGHDWKAFTGSSWEIPADLAYFVKTTDNYVYKIVFIDFEGSATGITTLERTNLGVLSSLSGPPAQASYLVYPSVVEKGKLNIVWESQDRAALTVSLVNLNGQVVFTQALNQQADFEAFELQLPALAAGMYKVLLHTDKQAACETIWVR